MIASSADGVRSTQGTLVMRLGIVDCENDVPRNASSDYQRDIMSPDRMGIGKPARQGCV